jgi:hypothetical protein
VNSSGAFRQGIKLAQSPTVRGIHLPEPEAALTTQQQVCVMILMDVPTSQRAWGYSRFVWSRFALRHIPGLQFHKMLGSGANGGFGIKPSASRQGLFCVFESLASAKSFLNSALIQNYQHRAAEFFYAMLQAYSSKGAWAGQTLQACATQPQQGPVASLTRASIQLRHARAFWQKQPPAEAVLMQARGCFLAAGVGEAPLLRQATFSLWDSAKAMDAYARSGAHLQAIRAAYSGGYFSESMFTRFVPLALSGVYKGVHYGE